MVRRRYSKVLGAIGLGAAVLIGGIFSTAANASPLTARQVTGGPGAAQVNLTPAATNCGDGVSYRPTGGHGMTAADFAALGMPAPPAGSPLTRPGTRWIVPRCAPLPAGQLPGGPAARSTLTLSSQVGSRTATSAQMGASPNWTGFQSNGGGPFQGAFSAWIIPSSFPTPPGDTYESSWAGIGSGASKSNGLFQAGTETDVNTSGGVSNYAWWEFFPMNPQQVVNLSISSGSTDAAEVIHTGYGQGVVDLCTGPLGQSATCITPFNVTWGTAYTVGTSQFECIAERSELSNNTYPRLTDITGLQFSGCQTYISSANTWEPMNNYNRIYWYMAKTKTASQCRTAPWAAETGSISGLGDFGINWYGYGWPIPAADC